MAQKPSIPKGTRDFSPEEVNRRNYIISTIKKQFQHFGFQPIETPSFENSSTLMGKYGEEGDRLIFKILNSGDFLSKVKDDLYAEKDSLKITSKISEKALRYDLTVPFARYVVQHQNEVEFPFKRYQIQPVWRADRPQKGRFREFYQCDADVIGSKSLLNEIELIQLCDDIFSELNVPNINILINNRKILSAMIDLMSASEIFNEFVIVLDKIDKIGVDNVKSELIKIGVSDEKIGILDTFLNSNNVNELSNILKDSSIGMEGVSEMNYIFDKIEKLNLKNSTLKFDVSLARGLNYYTGSIFEVKSNDVEIGSIAGGGRYDDLTSIFGLDNVSGVGISFGIDRIFLVMDELNLFPEDIDISSRVLFVNFGEVESEFCLSLVKKLRDNNINSELYPSAEKIKKQMNYANNKGVQYVVMVGEDEMKSGKLSIKNMQTGDQEKMNISELIKILS